MAVDLTTPIDISSVIAAVRKHKDLMVSLRSEAASEILKHFTPMSGIKDSITLGRTSLMSVSRQYTGDFSGHVSAGAIVPRTLKVYPCVMEMKDEPERYRRAYITEVDGGLDPNKHPFEVWLINHGIKSASQDLFNCLLTADLDETASSQHRLQDSFNGPLTIITDEVADNKITTAIGNKIETGAFTRANVGTSLLEFWRAQKSTLRNAPNVKMYISEDLGDLYDDWLDDQGTLVTGSGAETAGQTFLRGTNHKCELVRLPGMPANSQFVMLTTKQNIVYGYDKETDFRRIVPFASGNPYKFTAAGKYVLGFQFVSLDPSELCINDQPVTPAVAG